MEKSSKTNTEIIVSSMLQIYNHLKLKGDLDTSGHGTDFLHWKNYPMDDDQKQARRLMDGVTKRFAEQNSQLSALPIYDSLLFNLTQSALWFPDEHLDVESEYREVTNHLLKYDAIAEIKIPIVNLEIEKPSINFGPVTFVKIETSDKQGEFWEAVKRVAGESIDYIYSFAKIKCPGDAIKSADYAFNVTSGILNILRAIGSPLESDPNSQFWLVNEYPLFQTRTYHSELISESFKLNYRPKIAIRSGPGLAVCFLKSNILESISPSTLSRLQTLMESDFIDPGSDLKRKLFLGLHWLGEATKPDTTESRFVKLSFSLEGLIGGDIGNPGNTKSVLADRCAALVAKDMKETKKIRDKIIQYYKIRSGIVHGAKIRVSDDDFLYFGILVRKTSWALLTVIDRFENINDLHNSLLGSLPRTRKGFIHMSLYDLWRWIK